MTTSNKNKEAVTVRMIQDSKRESWLVVPDILDLLNADKTKAARCADKVSGALVQKTEIPDASGNLEEALVVHQIGATIMIGVLMTGQKKNVEKEHEFLRAVSGDDFKDGYRGSNFEIKQIATPKGFECYLTAEEREWAELAGKTKIVQRSDGQWVKRKYGSEVGQMREEAYDPIGEKIRYFQDRFVWGIKMTGGRYPVTEDGLPSVYEQSEKLFEYVDQCGAMNKKPTVFIREGREAYRLVNGEVRALDNGEVLVRGEDENEPQGRARMEPISEGFKPGLTMKPPK